MKSFNVTIKSEAGDSAALSALLFGCSEDSKCHHVGKVPCLFQLLGQCAVHTAEHKPLDTVVYSSATQTCQ